MNLINLISLQSGSKVHQLPKGWKCWHSSHWWQWSRYICHCCPTRITSCSTRSSTWRQDFESQWHGHEGSNTRRSRTFPVIIARSNQFNCSISTRWIWSDCGFAKGRFILYQVSEDFEELCLKLATLFYLPLFIVMQSSFQLRNPRKIRDVFYQIWRFSRGRHPSQRCGWILASLQNGYD